MVIGTRGSALARWQAEHIAAALRAAHPGLQVELRIVVTSGDRTTAAAEAGALAAGAPGGAGGGKGLWVKEIEDALLAGDADLAVHSLKDVPAELAPGLVLTATPPRADPRDAVVSREGKTLDQLPAGAVVGTSSLRRVCQVRAARPDLQLVVLRGNVDTRLRKVTEGVVDAAVMACAGLDRLGQSARIAQRLSLDLMLPAIGQGALALEVRAANARVRGLCAALSDPAAEAAVAAERALLARLGASCRTPVAGHARVDGQQIEVLGLVGRPDGTDLLRERVTGARKDAAALGLALGDRLLARGADRILATLA